MWLTRMPIMQSQLLLVPNWCALCKRKIMARAVIWCWIRKAISGTSAITGLVNTGKAKWTELVRQFLSKQDLIFYCAFQEQVLMHKGSCHCGKIAFEVEGEIDSALACNCSICQRMGSLLWFVPR